MNSSVILDKLISINTEYDKSNLDAVNWISQYLAEYDIKAQIIEQNYKGTVDKNRACLIATIGNRDNPGIVLSGHLDTVSANDLSSWDSDPFKMYEERGNLYGLGSVDMKGGIAVALALVPEFKKSNKTFHLVLTHDEEYGFTGIRQLVDNNYYGLFNPREQQGCIVMEPTNMNIVFGHIGNQRFCIDVKGHKHHASNCARGVDALKIATKIYQYILNSFSNYQNHFDNRFEVPKSQLNIGTLNGGESDYFVPSEAKLSFSLRYLPGDNLEYFVQDIQNYINTDILPKLRMYASEGFVNMYELSHAKPFCCDKNSSFYKLVKNSNPTGKEETWLCCTEAGYLESSGLSTVVVGPGDIMQAHQYNEHNTISQIDKFSKFLLNMANVHQNQQTLALLQRRINLENER